MATKWIMSRNSGLEATSLLGHISNAMILMFSLTGFVHSLQCSIAYWSHAEKYGHSFRLQFVYEYMCIVSHISLKYVFVVFTTLHSFLCIYLLGLALPIYTCIESIGWTLTDLWICISTCYIGFVCEKVTRKKP